MKNKLKNKSSLRNLWDNIKHSNIHIIGVPEGENRKRYVFDEIMAEKHPKSELGNRYPSTGSTEGLKQDEPKQTQTKTS